MTTSFDLNVMPIGRASGMEQEGLPCLYTAEPPRRTARGRDADRLVFHLTLLGNAPLAAPKAQQLFAQLSKTYYDTPGTVTGALRVVVETLNQFLFERNSRGAGSGRQGIGLLNLAVLRGDNLYLAQSGPVHAFIISAGGVQHFYDADMQGRGLGQSRAMPLRFCHAELQANDTFLLTPRTFPAWTDDNLAGLFGQGPEGLRRRLINPKDLDVDVILAQVRPGKGAVVMLRQRPTGSTQPLAEAAARETAAREAAAGERASAATPVSPAPAAESVTPPVGQAAATASVSTSPPVSPAEPETPPVPAPASDASEPIIILPASLQEAAAAMAASETSQAEAVEPAAAVDVFPVEIPEPIVEAPLPETPLAEQALEQKSAEKSASAAPRSRSRREQRKAAFEKPDFNGFGRQATAAGQPALRALRSFLQKMAPGESLFSIPPSTMAFVAILVPIIVVTVATVVYFQRGSGAQYQAYYAQAVLAAEQAQQASDPATKQKSLETAMSYVRQAESFSKTDETERLRNQLQSNLDGMDLIRRLDYRPAIINGLPDDVQVVRIAEGEGEIYLLDGKTGKVLRADSTNRGYELDSSFQCGPGVPGNVGVIVDITAWPPGDSPAATVLALDDRGNAVFCLPGDTPMPQALAAPQDMQRSRLTRFSLDRGDLYTLDPVSKAVWVYWNSDFKNPPQYFFGEALPPSLDTVVDMAASDDQLYLLHKDGHLSLCTYRTSESAPTECIDPAPYIDYRPGREGSTMKLANPFTQMLYSQPPDPSLYFLEPKSRSISHFSLRTLAFQHQYIPLENLGNDEATAFAVDSVGRTFFMAIGNQVYYASMP